MKPSLYGLMVEFHEADALMKAIAAAREAGYTQMEAYAPFPLHGLPEALGRKPSKLPYIVLAGGITGALGGYLLQYYTSVISYPMNIGGRPIHSWPAFIPVTFECTILLSAFAAVLGMLALNGLPAPYHPVFNVPRFSAASRDRFFLCIESRDPRFDVEETTRFLEGLGVEEVFEVAP